MRKLTQEQLDAIPRITSPLPTLKGLTMLLLKPGTSRSAQRVFYDGGYLIVYGDDNRLYFRGDHGSSTPSLAYNPTHRLFSKTMLRLLRSAKIISQEAVAEHEQERKKALSQGVHFEKIQNLTMSLGRLGLKLTRNQQRELDRKARAAGLTPVPLLSSVPMLISPIK